MANVFYLVLVISEKIIALVVGVAFFRQLPIAYRLTMLQVLLGLVAEITGRYIVARYHEQNIWMFNFYWIAELWVAGMAGILLLKNPALRKAFISLLVLPSFFWLYFISVNGLAVMPSPALTAIDTSLVVIYATALFQNTVFEGRKLAAQPVFWLCLSVITFFACNIPLYSMFNYIYRTNPELLKKLFVITKTLNFIRYPMVAFSFYLYGRQAFSLKAKPHVL